jgi:hypothetical protein
MSDIKEEGWLPDPSDGSRLRWWDGSVWTNHLSRNGTMTKDELTLGELNALETPDRSARRRRRATIETMANTSKYRKPLREGTFANLNLLGGDWNDYANVALTAMLLETLLDIDERLEAIAVALTHRPSGGAPDAVESP